MSPWVSLPIQGDIKINSDSKRKLIENEMKLSIIFRALQDLSSQLKEATASDDENLKAKVDVHWNHISTQINRLKALKVRPITTEYIIVQLQKVLRNK